MKVSEAKEKVCPFIQYQEDAQHEMYHQNCICGDCIAWAYSNHIDNNGDELTENEKEGYCKRIDNG